MRPQIFPSSALADHCQKPNQLSELRLVQVAQLFLMDLFDPLLHLIEQPQPGFRDPGHHVAPVFAAALPANQLRRFEPVQQPRDVWNGTDEARSNLVPAQAIRLGAAQNPQHVVLRPGDPVRLERRFESVLEQRSRPLDAEMRFLLETLERFSLFEFRLQY